MDCVNNMFKNVFAKVLSAFSAIDLSNLLFMFLDEILNFFNKLWRLAERRQGFFKTTTNRNCQKDGLFKLSLGLWDCSHVPYYC
jgi:hypothetical protein